MPGDGERLMVYLYFIGLLWHRPREFQQYIVRLKKWKIWNVPIAATP